MEKPEHGCLSWEKGEPKSAKGDNGPSTRVYLLCAISQKSESQNQKEYSLGKASNGMEET